MAAYQRSETAGRARWALVVALCVAGSLVVVVLSAPLAGAHAVQTGALAEPIYQVTLRVGDGSEYLLAPGARVTMTIRASVQGAAGLGAASVLVQYDPLVVRPVACLPLPALPGGYCNAAYDLTQGLVRFNVLSDSGISGDVDLYQLSFEAPSTAEIRQVSFVTPLVESIADTTGSYMTSWAAGSSVKITAVDGGAAVYVGAPGGPNPMLITRGLTTTVPVVVTGVAGLGSASFSLSFDSRYVRPLECRPVQRPDGSASGACALHPDRIDGNLLALPPGLSGQVNVLEVVFTTAPNALFQDLSPLNLTVTAFADTAEAPIQVRLINNGLKVTKTAGASVPLLRLAPVAQNLYDDARVTVHLFMDNGAQLASGSWGIRYDPLVVLAETCQPASGVNAFCNATADSGLVRMSVLSVDGAPLPSELAAITFRRHPQVSSGQQSTLSWEVTNFANVAGEPLPYEWDGASIKVADSLSTSAAVAMRLVGVPPYLLYRGTDMDFPIEFTIDPARPIANLTASIHYDPRVLRPTQCLLNDLAVGGPMAYCNAHYDQQQGIIRFNLLSTEPISGTLTPFVFTVEPASGSVSGNNSPLHFTVEAVSGPAFEPRTWTATDEVVLIKDPVWAPRVVVGHPELAAQPTYTVSLGSTAIVPLWVADVPDLGAATVEVAYDPTITRATGCTLRSDLTPALDGGFCSLLWGAVRFSFASTVGITGTAQVYDIEFAQAPNALAGQTTPLEVTVRNFVNNREVPIPTTVRGGSIIIGCQAPPVEDLFIARSGDDLTLRWTATGSQTSLYEVWVSDPDPYFLFGETGSVLIGQLTAPTPGTSMVFTDALLSKWADPWNHYYMVRTRCAPAGASERSNRVGKFVRTVTPGMNLVSSPLLPMVPGATGIQDVIGQQLTGASNELYADRVWTWNAAGDDYDYAWLVAGVAPAYDGTWWDGVPWGPSTMPLPPGAGFWVQNRQTFSESLTFIGRVPAADSQSLAISYGMQLVGSAYPISMTLSATTMAADGAQGAPSELYADRVWSWLQAVEDYDYAWLVAGVSPSYDGRWWDGVPWGESTITLEPGVGYWFQRRSRRRPSSGQIPALREPGGNSVALAQGRQS